MKLYDLLLETTFEEFDNPSTSEWRKYGHNGQYKKAISIMLNFIKENLNKIDDYQLGGIYWHIGQMYAFDDNYNRAIYFMKKCGDAIEEEYKNGTIAFLKGDLNVLKKSISNMEDGTNKDILSSFLNSPTSKYKDIY